MGNVKAKTLGFLSYAHKDAELVDDFRSYFDDRAKIRTKLPIQLWSDHEILTGTPWRHEIQDVLTAAGLGLLLVSPSFLASDFIRDYEIRELIAQGKPLLLPMLVKVHPERVDAGELEGLQLFGYRERGSARSLAFEECEPGAERGAFCDRLLDQAEARL